MPRAAYLAAFVKRPYTGFDRVLRKVDVVAAENGNVLAKLKLEPEHLNSFGGLHGGLSATLVDIISSIGMFTHDIGENKSVSVNINMSYIKGAVEGDTILIDSKVLRVGKKMAYLDVEIRNEETGDLLVKAHHTKYIPSKI